MICITHLFIYPVKSCAAISLPEAELDEYGFRYDRAWMITDSEGNFLTQREVRSLALVQPSLDAESLHLQLPDGSLYTLPLQREDAEYRRVQVWEDSVEAMDEGDDVAAFLSDTLQTPCRLVRMTERSQRYISPNYARNNDRVHFGDAQPLHLMNSASLAELNGRLDTPVPMNRFRANIVVEGAAAFAEDNWQKLGINGIDFDVPKATARCVVTTIDQQTGQSGSEPLRTLAQFRKQGNKTLMGVYLLHHQKQGVLRQGDSVEVLG